MLEVSGLALSRPAVELGPISFTLPRPGCWWLTGVSGAGKSLLLESLAGFHADAIGSVRIEEREMHSLAPEQRSISLMPQRYKLFPHWSVERNLRFAANLSGSPDLQVQELAGRLQIGGLLRRKPRALSGGETQRIVLLQTLLSRAKVLLLDEPLAAIDSALKSIVLDLVQEDAVRNSRICLIAAHLPMHGCAFEGSLAIERGRLVPSRLD